MNQYEMLKLCVPTLILGVGAACHAQSTNCASQYSLSMGAEALEACAASVQASDTVQLTALGDIFFRRSSSKADRDRATSYFTRAAEAGDSQAQFKLGTALQLNDAPPELWLGWFEKAALSANGEAVDALTGGDWRVFESTNPKDRLTAQLYFEALSRLISRGRLVNDRYAQVASRLAYMYYKGEGTAPDRAQAAAWYARAGEQGGYKALWAAVKMHQLGDGIPQDSRKAEQLLGLFFEKQRDFWDENPEAYISWLKDAANLGFPSAALRLAEIYERGTHGVTPSKDVAEHWRKQARR